MLVGPGIWSPGTVGTQVHVGPLYADSYAGRNQMLIGQEGPAVVAAMRRGRGRFLSGFGGIDVAILSRYKVTGSFAMPLQGLSLTGVIVAELGPAEAAVPGQGALDWAKSKCGAGAGLRLFSDVTLGRLPTGNHLVATSDARLIEVLRGGTRVFGNQPMLEIDCPVAPGPALPPEPPPTHPGPVPGAAPNRMHTVLAIASVALAGVAAYYLLTRKPG